MNDGQVTIENVLPLFEGEEVNREVIKLRALEFEQPNGSEVLRRRSEHYAVVRFFVEEVNHKPDSDGWLERVATAKTTSAVIVDHGAGKELQRHWTEEHRRRIHERNAAATQNALQTELLASDVTASEGVTITKQDAEAILDNVRPLRSEVVAATPETQREGEGITFGCIGCGREVLLPYTSEAKDEIDIRPFAGWEVVPDDSGTFCPSCITEFDDRD